MKRERLGRSAREGREDVGVDREEVEGEREEGRGDRKCTWG